MSPGNVIPIRGQRPPGDGPPPHAADPRGDFVYKVTKHGREVEDDIANAIVVFRRDPAWAGVIAYDELSNEIVKRKTPPWYDVDRTGNDGPGAWEDSDISRTHSYLRRKWSITLGKDAIRDAVAVAADAAAFNPVKEWLAKLEHDGTPRIGMPSRAGDAGKPGWLTRYMRAADSDYARMIGRWHLLAAVARAYSPGEKVDTVPILESAQGMKKSTAIEILYTPWYSDTPLDLGSNNKYESLFGVWGYELAEFDQYSRHEASILKAFASKRVDKFRRPYGRCDTKNPRRVGFIATLNPSRPYINDETGARRWHPVKTSIDGRPADLDALAHDREQLWAEARDAYLTWECDHDPFGRWWPETPAEVKLCMVEQQDRQSVDVWQDRIDAHLSIKSAGTRVKPGEILSAVFNIAPDKWEEKPGGNTDRVQRCLRQAGWVRKRDGAPSADGTRGYHYYLPGAEPAEDPTE